VLKYDFRDEGGRAMLGAKAENSAGATVEAGNQFTGKYSTP